MRINATVASEVVFIVIDVCPTIRGTCLGNGPARLAGMVLDGGEKGVKSVKNCSAKGGSMSMAVMAAGKRRDSRQPLIRGNE